MTRLVSKFFFTTSLIVGGLLNSQAAHAQFNNLPKDTNVDPNAPLNIPAASLGNAGPKLEKPVTQQWKTGVVIRALTGPCAGLTGTFPVPLDWPEQQVKLADQIATPHFTKVGYRTTDDLVKQAVFAVPMIQAGDTAKMELTFDVINYVQVAPTQTSGYVIPKDLPGALRKFIIPSPYIESTNIKFKQLVRDAIDGKETAWEQLDAIYDSVRSKIVYERTNGKFFGAVGAITNKKADREDISSAFVAACRAHRVPARMVWVPDSCYAEFYLEDAEGKGYWFPAQLVGDKQFGGLEERKPILQKGDNIRVPETKDPQRFVTEFLTGKGKSGGKPDVEFVRRLEGLP